MEHVDFLKEQLAIKKYFLGKGCLEEAEKILAEIAKNKKNMSAEERNMIFCHILCLLAQGLFCPKIIKVVENTRYPRREIKKEKERKGAASSSSRMRSRSRSNESRISDLVKKEFARYAQDYPPLKINVMLRADSHGRGLKEKLECMGFAVNAVFRPGARLNEVLRMTEFKSLNVNVIVIIGGTNDAWNERLTVDECVNSMNLSVLRASTVKVLIVEIFKRFGVRGGARVNKRISEINSLIVGQVAANRCVKFMSNEWMSREYYRKDGVHLNDCGKDELCRRIKEQLEKWMMGQ